MLCLSMKWSNLRRNLCPKCGKSLTWSLDVDRLYCPDKEECKFRISSDRMQTILAEMATDLFKFNHEEVSEEKEEEWYE